MPSAKPVGKVGRHPVYATKGGFKIGQQGKAQTPGQLYGKLTKGEARKIRKAARAQGLLAHAAAPRQWGKDESFVKTQSIRFSR